MVNKSIKLIETIKDINTTNLVGRRFRLRGGYDIEITSQNEQLIIASKLSNNRKTNDIRKYKLDNFEYLILKELPSTYTSIRY